MLNLRLSHQRIAAAAAAILLIAPLTSAAASGNGYLIHNLVADEYQMADFTDPNLVNPWGIITTATSPFWVADAGSGLSTVYSSNGAISATKPTIPPSAKGTLGAPTGIVANATGGFQVQGKPTNFIFVTADGTVSAWASAVSTTAAQLMVDNSSKGAIYYGLAISATTTNAAPLLYAANFATGAIDIFDTNYSPVSMPGAFTDPAVPAGFAPFNIQNLGGKLYVIYAKQNASKTFAATGGGYVSIYDLTGKLLQHLASNGPLNEPWGVAIAPATFGAFANDVLIGNFGDGMINAFDPGTGNALGAMIDENGNTVAISGLWGLILGNGGSGGDPNTIYFTAGPGNQKHGLLGSIQAPPNITSVNNAAAPQTALAGGIYISILGSGLSPVTRNWTNSDFSGVSLPKSLSGVSVTVNGKAAYVYYISPKQIDVLTPVDTTTGTVQVVVVNNGLASNSAPVTYAAVSPAFFVFVDGHSIAAQHADGAIVGATTLYAGLSTPANPGETIALYVNGLGPTNPAFADGTVISKDLNCASTPTVTVGGAPAAVQYCALVSSGLYQVNVTIPPGAAAGDNAVIITASTVASQANTTINVL